MIVKTSLKVLFILLNKLIKLLKNFIPVLKKYVGIKVSQKCFKLKIKVGEFGRLVHIGSLHIIINWRGSNKIQLLQFSGSVQVMQWKIELKRNKKSKKLDFSWGYGIQMVFVSFTRYITPKTIFTGICTKCFVGFVRIVIQTNRANMKRKIKSVITGLHDFEGFRICFDLYDWALNPNKHVFIPLSPLQVMIYTCSLSKEKFVFENTNCEYVYIHNLHYPWWIIIFTKKFLPKLITTTKNTRVAFAGAHWRFQL